MYSFSASRYCILSFSLWFSAIKSFSIDLFKGCFLGLHVLFLPRRSVMKPAAPSSKYMRSHRRSRERNLEQSVFVSTPQYFLTVSLYVIWFSRISIITAILNSGEYFVLNFFPLDMKICTSKSLSNFWGAYHSGWFFIFGHSPCLLGRAPRAHLSTCQSLRLLLATRKRAFLSASVAPLPKGSWRGGA